MNRIKSLLLVTMSTLTFVLVIQTPCDARHRRTQSLVEESTREIKLRQPKPTAPLSIGTSPLLHQVAETDEQVAQHLRQTEDQVRLDLEEAATHAKQVAKAGEEKLQKLEQEKFDLATRLQNQYIQSSQKLEQNFAQQKSNINEQVSNQQKQIITKAEKEASTRINRMEIALLEKHLHRKRTDITAPLFSPTKKKSDLALWKKIKKSELSKSIDYLGPILDADPELSAIFKQKQLLIDTKITSSQAVGDRAYNVVQKEVKKLSIMRDTQKEADRLLTDALERLADVSGEIRQQLRLTVLYELPAMIEETLKTHKKISSQSLQNLVTQAVSHIEAKSFDCDYVDDNDGIPDIDVMKPATQQVAKLQLSQQLAALKQELASEKLEKKTY
ncbi:hypothetical protein KAU11_03965 [Candidatus Babeliales bacterium]|nr:hypothetical protein [Candidatus Babeliales bacterium]